MSKQNIYLEHANITVNDLNAAIEFFQKAFPHFKIRGRGKQAHEWVHLGDDHTYVALNQALELTSAAGKNYYRAGINHLGFVVEDAEEIANNLATAGYERGYPKQVEKFRIREYFLDKEGNEYEFVQYLSEEIAERNSYA